MTLISKATFARLAPMLCIGVGITLGTPHALRAETVAVNDQLAVRESNIARPARGMTMTRVESKFGAPQERHPTVGVPPITRWDYQGFSVFFEKDRVIDSVVAPAPTAAEPTDAAPAPVSAPPAETPAAPAEQPAPTS